MANWNRAATAFLLSAVALALCQVGVSTADRTNIQRVLRDFDRVTLGNIAEEVFRQDRTSDAVKASRTRPPIHLKVEAFGRVFPITLHKGTSVYTPNAKLVIHDNDNISEVSATQFGSSAVEGYILDDPDSYVHGHVTDGVFVGIISTPSENYYVEPASRYFSDVGRYEAVVYRESDVRCCVGSGHARERVFCSGNGTSVVQSNSSNAGERHDVERLAGEATAYNVSSGFGHVCRTKVVADHVFLRDFAGGDLRKVVDHMELMIREADLMFSVTDFDLNELPDDVRIRIAEMVIYKTKHERGYRMSCESMGHERYLSVFATYNHDGFCAAVAFTHRKFDDGVLGYAFSGGPDLKGGICDRHTMIRGEVRSSNVAVISTRSMYGTTVMAKNAIVITHELGHMFGSGHDESMYGGECRSQESRKKYIMSKEANPGKSSVNRQFSPCSRRAIKENLDVHGQCLVCRKKNCDGDHRGGSPRSAAIHTSPIRHLVSSLLLFAYLKPFDIP